MPDEKTAIRCRVFARIIRARRAVSGMTQAEAASELCVSQSTISMWEQGKRIPRSCVLLRVSAWVDEGKLFERSQAIRLERAVAAAELRRRSELRSVIGAALEGGLISGTTADAWERSAGIARKR